MQFNPVFFEEHLLTFVKLSALSEQVPPNQRLREANGILRGEVARMRVIRGPCRASALLGVLEGAGPDELANAFRVQALRWHPDRSDNCLST